jgi:hypothetical protein
VYLPNKKEEANGSNARHSTVQYMVLAVLVGSANAKFTLLLKDTKNVVLFLMA